MWDRRCRPNAKKCACSWPTSLQAIYTNSLYVADYLRQTNFRWLLMLSLIRLLIKTTRYTCIYFKYYNIIKQRDAQHGYPWGTPFTVGVRRHWKCFRLCIHCYCDIYASLAQRHVQGQMEKRHQRALVEVLIIYRLYNSFSFFYQKYLTWPSLTDFSFSSPVSHIC